MLEWWGTFSPVDAFPCGSRSITKTRLPCSARATAILTVVVVLPTPPFWLATQTIRHFGGLGIVISPLGFRISTARRASWASGGSSVSRRANSSTAGPGPAGKDCSATASSVSTRGVVDWWRWVDRGDGAGRSEEHTSELQSLRQLVC